MKNLFDIPKKTTENTNLPTSLEETINMFQAEWENQWIKPITMEQKKKIEYGAKINKDVTAGLYLHYLKLKVKPFDHADYERMVKNKEFKMQPNPPFKIELSNIKGVDLWNVYARFAPSKEYKHLKESMAMDFERNFEDFNDAIKYFLSVSNTYHQNLKSVYETFKKLWEVRNWHAVLTDTAIELHEKRPDGTPKEQSEITLGYSHSPIHFSDYPDNGNTANEPWYFKYTYIVRYKTFNEAAKHFCSTICSTEEKIEPNKKTKEK